MFIPMLMIFHILVYFTLSPITALLLLHSSDSIGFVMPCTLQFSI